MNAALPFRSPARSKMGGFWPGSRDRSGRKSQPFEQHARDYLRPKMHQLGLPRGVAFCFDETTRELVGVYFDDHVGELEPQSRSTIVAP